MKFRVLEKHTRRADWRFSIRLREISKAFTRFNVTYLGIDITALGAGCMTCCAINTPRETVAIHYSNENKTVW
ncbi:hypothetical protein ACT691_13485 [Vibrio metschnikovii]